MVVFIMSSKSVCSIVFSALLASLVLSGNANACDSKACEIAYKNSTTHYADIRIRHAVMQRAERLAYAKNRENTDIANQLKTHRYVENKMRHTVMTRAEKLAYAKNRERRAYAINKHIQQMQASHSHAVALTGKDVIKQENPGQLTSMPSDINHVKLEK